MLGYLIRLTKRMNKPKFPPDYPVLQAPSEARECDVRAAPHNALS
jgi:hypothetical protein